MVPDPEYFQTVDTSTSPLPRPSHLVSLEAVRAKEVWPASLHTWSQQSFQAIVLYISKHFQSGALRIPAIHGDKITKK